MVAIWLVEKVAYQNNRAVEKVWKLLPDICVHEEADKLASTRGLHTSTVQ